MSNATRTILTVLLVIAMAVTAFTAGYLVNDFMEARLGVGTAAAQSRALLDGDLPIFREAWGLIEGNFIGELPTTQELEYAALRGSIGELDDPYTLFIEPVVRQQEIESLRGNFGGIGATLRRDEAGHVILTPIPGNPAEGAGIISGDRLVAVDGIALSEDLSVAAIAQQIRGEKGTAVILTVIHPGEETPTDVNIIRGDILIPSVSARMLEEAPTVGYIQLTRFSGESGQEVHDAIVELRAAGALQLILDLRRNGGGLLDAAVDVSDHFLDSLPVLHQSSRAEEEKTFFTTEATVAADVPLVVLINEASASASEIVAGALRDHGRATLVGQRSFGKGSVQLVYDLSDGSSVHVTSARWLTPERHQIDQQGLEPDIFVEATQNDLDNGRDPTLEAAIDFLIN